MWSRVCWAAASQLNLEGEFVSIFGHGGAHDLEGMDPPVHRSDTAGGYFFRVSVTLANGDAFPDLSTLSIVHDHASVARSYAKVV